MPDPRTSTDAEPPPASFAAGPIVLRRRRAVLVYLLFSDVLLLGAAGLAASQGSRWTPLAVAVGAAVIAWAALASLRARTDLRPDGVWNRTVRTKELISWADISRAMATGAGAVFLTRRGGGTVKLAGLLGTRPAKGPAIEEILAVIRSQIESHRPAGHVPETTPPTVIERRLSLRPALSLVIFLGTAGVLCGVFAAVSRWLVAPAVLCLGLAAFTVVATARARTVIGPDGIDNRALRKRVFIPWPDIKDVTISSTPPRTVTLVRHDGATTVLAAVRDADVPPDGLGPDDIANLIKERAGVAEVAPAPLAEAQPLSLRPSRRPLLWIVPLAAGLVTAWTFGLGDVHFVIVSGYLLAVPAYLLALSVLLLRGRTDADADGLRNRSLGRTRELRWRDVEEFVVMPTLFGRVVQVVPTSGKRMTLAAPRESLLARRSDLDRSLATMRALAAAHRPSPPGRQNLSPVTMRTVWVALLAIAAGVVTFLWHPWLEPWWPGRHEATRLPTACSVLDPATVRRMVPQARRDSADHQDLSYSVTSRCQFSGETGASLELTLKLERRTAFSSGTDEAHDDFASSRQYVPGGREERAAAIPGLGDEAWRRIHWYEEESSADLLVRRRNVVVEVDYHAERSADRVGADAEALARRIVTDVPTDT